MEKVLGMINQFYILFYYYYYDYYKNIMIFLLIYFFDFIGEPTWNFNWVYLVKPLKIWKKLKEEIPKRFI